MDWLTGVYTTIFTSLFIGILLHLFKTNIDARAAETKRANDMQSSNIVEKISSVEKKANGLEVKVDAIVKDIHRLDKKMEVLSIQQVHIAESTGRIEKEIERYAGASDNHGKVIKK